MRKEFIVTIDCTGCSKEEVWDYFIRCCVDEIGVCELHGMKIKEKENI